MTHLDLSGCKKRKRGDRIFKFKTFGESGHPVIWDDESFWENVKALLEFGHLENDLFCGRVSWSFELEVHRHPPVHVFMFIVEELVELLANRHCKYCQYAEEKEKNLNSLDCLVKENASKLKRYNEKTNKELKADAPIHIISGWGHNLICNKKYHFLMCSKDTAMSCLDYKSNSQRATLIKGKSNFVELKDQIMHGVFHSNGFGHLLSVNGLETGSCLPGYQIMDFWNRLCDGLRARKVSLNDIANKKNMDLRLLHGLAYGEPWFGRWGYRFGRGSFGVTQTMYQKATEAIKSMPLNLIIHQLRNPNTEIPVVFSRYQTLSGHSLVTLGDLFHFTLELKSRLPKDTCSDSYSTGILMETNCRWSSKRVEMAIRVIVDALKRAEFKWISRQEVRDAARSYIGDTGLLDFVLKSLGNHIVGNYLVRRSLNPVTKVLEYCLEDVSNSFLKQEGLESGELKMKARYMITKVQLLKDLFYLYKYIIRENRPTITTGVFATIQLASRIILDAKLLIKEYYCGISTKLDVVGASKAKIYSTIILRNENVIDDRLRNVIAPYMCFELASNPSFDELKAQVEKSFRETYWGLRSFEIESIANISAKGSNSDFGIIEGGGKVVFQGKISDTQVNLEDIFEGPIAKCSMDCPCGAKEDDGERMVSCDICEVLQHTRCVRIPNTEEVPSIFLCSRCEHEIVSFPACLP